jgi:hypothetical protein
MTNPEIMTLFKDALLSLIISYCQRKINPLRLNNQFLMEKEDLAFLISILIDRPVDDVKIETEDVDVESLSDVVEIMEIKIDGIGSFRDCYGNICEEMEIDFCINLEQVTVMNEIFHETCSNIK